MWGAAAQVRWHPSVGWKIDRPLHLHSLSRHPQEIGGAVDQHNVLSILLRYGALFDAVNIGDGKSSWAYRYTRTRARSVARLASMVSMGEEIEMSSGMGAPA
jgi:hypothetical protein